MQHMKVEKDDAMEKQETNEGHLKVAETRVMKTQEEVNELKKRFAQLEAEYAVAQETYTRVTTTLAEKEKKLTATELELNQCGKKLQIVEEKFETTEEKLKADTAQLVIVMQTGDDAERMRKVLENRSQTDGERIKSLEASLKDVTKDAEEGDRKCSETQEKLGVTELEVEYNEERATNTEETILQQTEELKVVENNLKSLEVSEINARQMEDDLKKTIKNLTAKMKQAEARAEYAERTVQKLLKSVDMCEDELRNQKEKFKAITTELEVTYSEMTGY